MIIIFSSIILFFFLYNVANPKPCECRQFTNMCKTVTRQGGRTSISPVMFIYECIPQVRRVSGHVHIHKYVCDDSHWFPLFLLFSDCILELSDKYSCFYSDTIHIKKLHFMSFYYIKKGHLHTCVLKSLGMHLLIVGIPQYSLCIVVMR